MSGDGKREAKIECALIAGGKFHDIDFARLELLKLLAEDERVRVRVFEDYSNHEALAAADVLLTYTCDVIPSLDAQEMLRVLVERGLRWFALHGTNSILRFLKSGEVDCPNLAPCSWRLWARASSPIRRSRHIGCQSPTLAIRWWAESTRLTRKTSST